jgi:fructose PTS system EIIBC or EIIC component
MRFVAVTSCPTGIAHSEMAAEAIEVAAKERGHDIDVEVQGAAGDPPLSAATIAAAEAVIFAVDATVRDEDRFASLPRVQVRTREAIDRAGEIVDRAVAAAEQRVPVAAGAVTTDGATPAAADDGGDDLMASVTSSGGGKGEEVRRWLMTGVSYMIPFVVAGGILIAVAFAIGGAVEVTEVEVVTDTGAIQLWTDADVPFLTWFGAVLNTIGGAAFGMLVPILAGFIAFAMADRPGIAPGLVAGLLANTIEAGFLGGIVGGLLAGALVLAMKRIPAKGTLKRMMPVLVYPLVGTVVVGLLMLLVVGEPVAALNRAMTSWLDGLTGANAIVLGLVVGGMMAVDLGGPVNKVAYAFGIAGLEAGNLGVMAAVMAAGMTPPLALALASAVRPKLFTEGERKAGSAGWVMGASFITEGAIPFAAADPLRVLPSLIAGSALAGALSLGFGATLNAPHGGIWVIGVIGNAGLYLVAIALGTLLSAALVIILKSLRDRAAVSPEVARA